MFIGSFVCRVKPDKRSEFRASVGDLMDRVRWQQGCVDCRLAVDVETTGAYTVLSEWMDRASLDRFLQSSEYRVIRGMRVLMQDETAIRHRRSAAAIYAAILSSRPATVAVSA